MASAKRFVRHAANIGGGLIVLSLVIGPAFSRYYWGYWFSPPGLGPVVRELTTLHAFAKVDAEHTAPNLAWKVSMLSPAEIAEGARWYRSSPIDAFWYRLHSAVADANLNVTPSDSSPESVLGGVERDIALSELLVEGDPGYPFAKRLNGYAAIGSASSGVTMVVLALKGSEVANDHYPVFDFAYECGADGCRRTMHNRYFEDVAGIEGFRWQLASLAAFVVGIAAVAVSSGLWWSIAAATRLLRTHSTGAA